jgi:hypothetical protein
MRWVFPVAVVRRAMAGQEAELRGIRGPYALDVRGAGELHMSEGCGESSPGIVVSRTLLGNSGGDGHMSVHVGTPARAPVSDAPRAVGANPSRPTRPWSAAFLVALVTVQLVWMAVLLYAAYGMVGTIGGLF